MASIKEEKAAATKAILGAVAKLEEAKIIMNRLYLPQTPLITVKNRLSLILGQIEKVREDWQP